MSNRPSRGRQLRHDPAPTAPYNPPMSLILADSPYLHPLNGLGYQFFSGIGSSISEWASVIVLISVYLYHHNCHKHHCWRIAWHPGPDGHPVCRVHHEDHPRKGTRLAHWLHQQHLRLKHKPPAQATRQR
jgi:hypothetical protein